jgi:hypothetical protein
MTKNGRTRRDFTLTWTLDALPRRSSRRGPTRITPPEPIELDLRVGGVWRQHMMIDESTAYVTGGIYREIVPDEKLVFAWGATDGWPRLDPDQLDAASLPDLRAPRPLSDPSSVRLSSG